MDHGEAELSDRSGAAVAVSLWRPSWCGQRERPTGTVCLPKAAGLRLAEEPAGTVPTMARWKAW